MQETKSEFLGGTPPHVTLILGILVGIIGTIVVSYIMNAPISAESQETEKVKQEEVVAPNIPGMPKGVPSPIDIKIEEGDYVRGNVNAPIEIIEYSDFECPFCSRHTDTMDQVLKEYDGKIKFTYRHFPLNSIHPNAQKAAEAVECAGEQGKFWEMHDELFALSVEKKLDLVSVKQAAVQLGINEGQFNECVDSGKMTEKVNTQAQQATKYGVNGTPGTFVNGTLISGAVPYEQFKAIIDSELANIK